MNNSAQTPPANEDGGDPFAEAKSALLPPLRNRTLAQAAAALTEGRPDIAEPLVSRHLKKHPRDHEALNLLADVARRAGRFEEAENTLVRCLKLSPNSAGYRYNYVLVLRRRNKFEQALAQLDELLSLDPRSPIYRNQKAALLRILGRHADALSYRRELVEEYPTLPDVWLHYAHALRGLGSNDQCVAAYRKALELSPSLIAAYSHLASLKTYRFTAVEIAQMEAQLGRPDLSVQDRADLHFALGKALGEEKSYAKSFDNYAKGNALRRLGVDFDPKLLTAHRLNNQSLFTEAFFRDRQGWGCDSRAPIFIVGMPRSGSTLVEQILSSHSSIEALGELFDLDVIVGETLGRTEGDAPHLYWIGGWFEFRKGLVQAFSRVVSRLDTGDFRRMGEEYLEVAGSKRRLGRPFFTDKSLRNFGYVGLIHLVFPNAKIVDARRHPFDCGWSCFNSDFPGGQPFATRLSDIGNHYANYVRLMAHFDRVLPGRVHRVIYEDLVANPETVVRQLFEYLELPFEEQCLRFHENERAVATLSSEQVRKPLYKSGIEQWRPYEEWLGPLKVALGPVLEAYPFAPDEDRQSS